MTSSLSKEPDAEAAPASAASKMFDIRILIGGLFLVYGVMLTIAGFLVSDKARAKAAGININLWLGIGMLVVGIIFLVWRALNPIEVEPNPVDAPEASGGSGHGH
jgi:hypothetical protein